MTGTPPHPLSRYAPTKEASHEFGKLFQKLWVCSFLCFAILTMQNSVHEVNSNGYLPSFAQKEPAFHSQEATICESSMMCSNFQTGQLPLLSPQRPSLTEALLPTPTLSPGKAINFYQCHDPKCNIDFQLHASQIKSSEAPSGLSCSKLVGCSIFHSIFSKRVHVYLWLSKKDLKFFLGNPFCFLTSSDFCSNPWVPLHCICLRTLHHLQSAVIWRTSATETEKKPQPEQLRRPSSNAINHRAIRHALDWKG